MARIFITGSSTGLGLMAGEWLAGQGHRVVLHGRNQARAEDARRALPKAEAVVTGDLSSLAGTREVADEVNKLGACITAREAARRLSTRRGGSGGSIVGVYGHLVPVN